MPHGFNDPSKKGWYWGGQVAFLWWSRLIRLTGTLEPGRSLFLQSSSDRFSVHWEETVAAIRAIWTLAACEGGSSPPVRLEFRIVHRKKLFWERLLLSFFLNLYPSRVLHRKWPQCSLWIPGQLQSQQKQVDFKLNKEKAVWTTLCFKRCTMWLGLGKDKEAMRDKVSSVCFSWPPLDCPATDYGRERRKQLSPCWLASSPPHFPAWRDTPSSTHCVLSVRDRTHLQWRRAAFKALFGAGGEWQ